MLAKAICPLTCKQCQALSASVPASPCVTWTPDRSRQAAASGDASIIFSFQNLEVLGLTGPLQGPATPNKKPLTYQMPASLVLSQLQELLIPDANLQGPMPLVWRTEQLRTLGLYSSQHGKCPFKDLPRLENFEIEANLAGTFPNIFRSALNLKRFQLSFTELNGVFPMVQNIPTLQRFIVIQNKFTEHQAFQSPFKGLVSFLVCIFFVSDP